MSVSQTISGRYKLRAFRTVFHSRIPATNKSVKQRGGGGGEREVRRERGSGRANCGRAAFTPEFVHSSNFKLKVSHSVTNKERGRERGRERGQERERERERDRQSVSHRSREGVGEVGGDMTAETRLKGSFIKQKYTLFIVTFYNFLPLKTELEGCFWYPCFETETAAADGHVSGGGGEAKSDFLASHRIQPGDKLSPSLSPSLPPFLSSLFNAAKVFPLRRQRVKVPSPLCNDAAGTYRRLDHAWPSKVAGNSNRNTAILTLLYL